MLFKFNGLVKGVRGCPNWSIGDIGLSFLSHTEEFGSKIVIAIEGEYNEYDYDSSTDEFTVYDTIAEAVRIYHDQEVTCWLSNRPFTTEELEELIAEKFELEAYDKALKYLKPLFLKSPQHPSISSLLTLYAMLNSEQQTHSPKTLLTTLNQIFDDYLNIGENIKHSIISLEPLSATLVVTFLMSRGIAENKKEAELREIAVQAKPFMDIAQEHKSELSDSDLASLYYWSVITMMALDTPKYLNIADYLDEGLEQVSKAIDLEPKNIEYLELRISLLTVAGRANDVQIDKENLAQLRSERMNRIGKAMAEATGDAARIITTPSARKDFFIFDPRESHGSISTNRF